MKKPTAEKTKSKKRGTVSEAIKKKILKEIFWLMSELSLPNLIKMVSLGEVLTFRKTTQSAARAIKKALKENRSTAKLVLDAFSVLSRSCKEKLIENFFINAGIMADRLRKKVEKRLGFKLPWLLVISPTARCNLHCQGCYAGEYSKERELSLEEVDRILTEAKELGIYFITISGGEPFSWSPLFKILEKHNDIFFQIYTNGTLITDEVAKKLAKLGNVAPAISVEGFKKETDQRRGQGAFEKILRGMANLKKHGILFGFSATCTSKNSDLLGSDAFINFYIKQGCRFGWYFQYMPIGRKPDLSLMSTPEQRNKLRIRVSQIRNTKPIFIGDFWNDGPWVKGCLAGARPGGYFHINCRGDVEPCVFLQFSVDNIKGKRLVDVIQSPFFKALQKAQPYCSNKNLLTPCVIIDNPQVLREIITKHHAKPSYFGGEDLINDPEVAAFLDNYSQEYKEITDPIWEKELSCRFKCWKDA